MRAVLLSTVAVIASAHAWATCGPVNVVTNPTATGAFQTQNGQIIGPNGQPFVARGLNVYDSDMGQAQQILALFPGVNFIRLNVYSYQSPGAYQQFINTMTARGVGVAMEDHTNNAGGGNAGGGQGSAFTGQQLSAESSWYSSVASAFASNPYVWFGTDNEPPAAGLTPWQQATYQAIRSTGNKNPIMISLAGGGDPNVPPAGLGMNLGAYASMTNIIADAHFYGWSAGYSTDQQTVNAALTSLISGAQTMQSASGSVPVIIGEYGDSTNGQSVDANWQQVVQAVDGSGAGSAAWNWSPGAPADILQNGGQLTAYGQAVASFFGSSCSVTSTAVNVASGIASGQQALAAANAMSVAQVASLAAAGETAGGQSTSAAGQAGATLPTDPTTAAVLAAGPAPQPQPIVLASVSPGGTMPTPAPASGTTTIDVSAGDGTGTITGTGNIVVATGGAESVTLAGPGNSLTTGPYNDTVTVQSAGNVINTGGGNDTVILAYGGAPPADTINADAAAVAPLGKAGNIFQAPPVGVGVLTIKGVLAANDTIDLTNALAGTTWNHQPGTMWNYMSATASPSGCVISVGGKPVVLLPNGSPNGNIGPFITAH